METMKLIIERPLSEYNPVKRMEYEIVQDATLDDILDIFKDLLIIMGYSLNSNEQLEIIEPNKEE